MEYQETAGLFDFAEKDSAVRTRTLKENENETLPIWYQQDDGTKIIDPGPGPYLPVWQTSPVFDGTVNENLLRSNLGASKSFTTDSVVISEFITSASGDMDSDDPRTAFFALLLSTAAQERVTYQGDPISKVYFPIFDSFDDDRTSVAILVAWINWASYFVSILPYNVVGIEVVLQDSCGGAFTYRIDGEQVITIGDGDLHETRYHEMQRSASFDLVSNIADGTKHGLPLNQEHCNIVLDVYPSSDFFDTYKTNTPIILTLAVAIIFVFTACMFLVYDRLVERRQALIMWNAEKSTAIVSSLFPDNVRDRLMQAGSDSGDYVPTQHRLQSFLKKGAAGDDKALAPIADLYPHSTVLFADIAGFTSWSSVRHPTQVFELLQAVYQAFDEVRSERLDLLHVAFRGSWKLTRFSLFAHLNRSLQGVRCLKSKRSATPT